MQQTVRIVVMVDGRLECVQVDDKGRYELLDNETGQWRPDTTGTVDKARQNCMKFLLAHTKPHADAFLAECEAKANVAQEIARKAARGPWLSWETCVVQDPKLGNDGAGYRIADLVPMNPRVHNQTANGPFIAHARTSNPDLAERVLLLVKMVRERDVEIVRLQEIETKWNEFWTKVREACGMGPNDADPSSPD